MVQLPVCIPDHFGDGLNILVLFLYSSHAPYTIRKYPQYDHLSVSVIVATSSSLPREMSWLKEDKAPLATGWC